MLEFLISFAAFIFVIFIIISVHELGHFLCARSFGVRVDVFSIGFGPEIWGWNDSKNTRWRICCIPLGGYVKFYGDENPASAPRSKPPEAWTEADRAAAFFAQSWWKRFFIALAGPFTNFLLSSLIWACVFFVVGVALIKPVIHKVDKGSPAEQAGFQKGDVISQVNGVVVNDISQVVKMASAHAEKVLHLRILRDKKLKEISVIPDANGHIGVWFAMPTDVKEIQFQKKGLGRSLVMGVERTYDAVAATASFIKGIFVKKEGLEAIGGPIQIAKISRQAIHTGWVAFAHIVALLSVSIGFINLLPIPILDGGHALLCLLEGAWRRPLGEMFVQAFNIVGMFILAGLFLLSTWNDVTHLDFVKKLFNLFHAT